MLKDSEMASVNGEATSPLELQCTNHTVIFRNASLAEKYPGGLAAFRTRYRVDANDHITVHCVANAVTGNTVREFEAIGLKQGQDFVAIDTVECEMWRIIHSKKVDRPFWFETGADWLGCRNWKGGVLVWYDG